MVKIYFSSNVFTVDSISIIYEITWTKKLNRAYQFLSFNPIKNSMQFLSKKFRQLWAHLNSNKNIYSRSEDACIMLHYIWRWHHFKNYFHSTVVSIYVIDRPKKEKKSKAHISQTGNYGIIEEILNLEWDFFTSLLRANIMNKKQIYSQEMWW